MHIANTWSSAEEKGAFFSLRGDFLCWREEKATVGKLPHEKHFFIAWRVYKIGPCNHEKKIGEGPIFATADGSIRWEAKCPF